MLTSGRSKRLTWFGTALLASSLLCGCSVKRMAVNRLGDALAGSGTTFASDDDPEFVGNATPFSLKLIESLLSESPNHRGLLLAGCSGFTQYAYVYIQQEADRTESTDLQQHMILKARARRMYLRARDYGLRGLELSSKGFRSRLREDPKRAAQSITRKDVALLYWTASSWALAITNAKDDPDLIADQTTVEALIDRAHQLDPDFDRGAIESFLISYEAVRQGATGDSAERSRRHFDRAVALSAGQLASPYVAMAESVSLTKQDRKEFEDLLGLALKINPDTHPETRLANLIMQRRARWLLSRADELFLAEAHSTQTFSVSLKSSLPESIQ